VGSKGRFRTLSTVYDGQETASNRVERQRERYQNTNIQPGFKARLTFLELAGINLQRCSHRGGQG
jgi:hypothetical protein